MHRSLIIIGSIGYDLHITSDSNGIFLTEGGFAYHAAVGVMVGKKSATVLANCSKGFDLRRLGVFDGQNVRFVLNTVQSAENVYIFDYRGSKMKAPLGLAFSEGLGELDITSLLGPLTELPVHAHVGTTNPDRMNDRIKKLMNWGKGKVSISTNYYLSYLKDDLPLCIKIAKFASILFMNHEEFLYLKEQGALDAVSHQKIMVVTCGKSGVALFYNGFLLSSVPITPKAEKSAVGAGDIFLGTFLSSFLDGECPTKSLLAGVKVAGESVLEFGTTHLISSFGNMDGTNSPSWKAHHCSGIQDFDPLQISKCTRKICVKVEGDNVWVSKKSIENSKVVSVREEKKPPSNAQVWAFNYAAMSQEETLIEISIDIHALPSGAVFFSKENEFYLNEKEVLNIRNLLDSVKQIRKLLF